MMFREGLHTHSYSLTGSGFKLGFGIKNLVQLCIFPGTLHMKQPVHSLQHTHNSLETFWLTLFSFQALKKKSHGSKYLFGVSPLTGGQQYLHVSVGRNCPRSHTSINC